MLWNVFLSLLRYKYFRNRNMDNENSEMSIYSLNFGTLNVNGLTRKVKKTFFLAKLCTSLIFSQLLTETWISNEIDLKIKGYTAFNELAVRNIRKAEDLVEYFILKIGSNVGLRK